MSYIKREAALDAVRHAWAKGLEPTQYIEELSAVDVAPVVHGRWEHDHYEDCTEQFEIVKCSNCGYSAYAMALFVKSGNYCPNCGARMDGADG